LKNIKVFWVKAFFYIVLG